MILKDPYLDVLSVMYPPQWIRELLVFTPGTSTEADEENLVRLHDNKTSFGMEIETEIREIGVNDE